jgi:hypothetical protein
MFSTFVRRGPGGGASRMDRGDMLFLVVALLFFLVVTTLSSRGWLDRFWDFLIKR